MMTVVMKRYDLTNMQIPMVKIRCIGERFNFMMEIIQLPNYFAYSNLAQ